MNAIKRAPRLRFPEFTGEWQEKRLGEVFDYQQPTPYLVRSTEYKDTYKTPVLTAGKTFVLGYTNEAEGVYTDLPVTLFDDFTTAVQWVDFPFKVKSSAVKILKTKAEHNPKIAHELLSKVQFKAENHQRHWISIYQNLSVYTPSLPEQQKIAAFLAAVDKRVALLECKVQQLEAYKRGVMQQLFSQQLRFTRPDGSHFPAWQEKRLGEITVNKPSTITAGQLSDSFEGYAVYGASGIAGYVKSFQHEQPYTAIVKDGAGAGRLLWCEGETSVLSTLTVLLPRQGIDTGYLHYVLQGIDFSKYITGSTIPHVYYRDFSKAKLKVPTLEEQQKTATFLSALDEKITLTRQQLDKTKQFKKGLLQRMFV